MFVPVAGRLVGLVASRRERIGLIVLLGLSVYLVKVLRSPVSFVYFDEFLHWRTADDIGRYGRLFSENPVLPVSPLYPGLEIVTNAVASLSGLSAFHAGIIVLGAARLVVMLSLYLLYEAVSRSERVAGIATLLYMANPHFLFFDAQFAYESLALPFALLTLWAVAGRPSRHHIVDKGLSPAVLLPLGAVVITHHLTSYILVAFLVLLTATFLVQGRGSEAWAGPGAAALLGAAACLAWLVFIASPVVAYLAPTLTDSVRQLVRLIQGEPTGRQLFHDYAGDITPLWERVISFTSTLCILFGLPFGLLAVWRHHRTSAVALALAGCALAYPATLVLRFTPAGADVSDRSFAFLFVAIAFVLAIGVSELALACTPGWSRAIPITIWATIVLIGGSLLGSGPHWARLPGPYLVSADMRSIEPQGIAAAEWAHAMLGPGNRVAADRINRLLMASYGDQHLVTALSDHVDVSPVYFSPRFGPAERALLRQGRVHYLVVDRRLSSGLPREGFYFDLGEPDARRHTKPINPVALAKFDRVQGLSRLYDGGAIVIYGLGAARDGR
jgi:hypothetical protein